MSQQIFFFPWVKLNVLVQWILTSFTQVQDNKGVTSFTKYFREIHVLVKHTQYGLGDKSVTLEDRRICTSNLLWNNQVYVLCSVNTLLFFTQECYRFVLKVWVQPLSWDGRTYKDRQRSDRSTKSICKSYTLKQTNRGEKRRSWFRFRPQLPLLSEWTHPAQYSCVCSL